MGHTRCCIWVGRFCALTAAVLKKRRKRDPLDVLSNRLRAMFPEIVDAAPILQSIPELSHLRVARADLARSIFSQDIVSAADRLTQDTMNVLVGAVDRDFADGRLVAVKGWTLSQTEVDLLAFISANEA